jgi:shikimate dehydrogenase
MIMLDINQPLLETLTADLRAGTDCPISGALLNAAEIAAAMARAEVIIQCTPIGMHPNVDATLIPAELFRTGQVVFDVVYNPLETKLLREAKAAGLQTISGVEMFINQAVLQFEQFTGIEAPYAVMRQVVMEQLGT